jgi:hypothetical protein
MKAPVYPLFNPQIPGIYGQILPMGRCHAKEKNDTRKRSLQRS